MEIHKKKSERTIIKCTECGFKYYDGDVHKCPTVSVEEEVDKEEIKDTGWPKKSKKK